MRTAVDAVFVGPDRAFNRRFQQMCSHYLTWFKKCCFQVTPKIARAALAKGFRVSSVTLI